MTCPRCSAPDMALIADTPVGPVLQCACGYAMAAARATQKPSVSAGRVKQGKLPGMGPGPQAVLVHEGEETIQARIVRALTVAGYQVESLVRRRKMQRCWDEEKQVGCGRVFHQQGSDGVSVFVGDLLVAVPRVCPRYWVMIDCKATNGRKRPGQKVTAAKGLLFFVRSVEEALAVAAEADAALARAVVTEEVEA